MNDYVAVTLVMLIASVMAGCPEPDSPPLLERPSSDASRQPVEPPEASPESSDEETPVTDGSAETLSEEPCASRYVFVNGERRCLDELLPALLPQLRDADGDGIPNLNDEDIDGDGVPNRWDLDVDGDGLSNAQDPDVDDDGVANEDDGDIDGDFIRNRWDLDIDGDLLYNPRDEDADGDGAEADKSEPDDDCGAVAFFNDPDDCDDGDDDDDEEVDSKNKESVDEDRGPSEAESRGANTPRSAEDVADDDSIDDPAEAPEDDEVDEGDDDDDEPQNQGPNINPGPDDDDGAGGAALRATPTPAEEDALRLQFVEAQVADEFDELVENEAAGGRAEVLDAFHALLEGVVSGDGRAASGLPDRAQADLAERVESVGILADRTEPLMDRVDVTNRLAGAAARIRDTGTLSLARATAAIGETTRSEGLLEDGERATSFTTEAVAVGSDAADVAPSIASAAEASERLDEPLALVWSVATRQLGPYEEDGGNKFSLPRVVVALNTIATGLDDPTAGAMESSLGNVLAAAASNDIADPTTIVDRLGTGEAIGDGISSEEANAAAEQIAAEN